ncbi:MAG TPA: baseplate J/gp47 family protein, partial [Bryobacteraceae bacterium]|nr:baseplate J/gp47 family protein [Bryobacteraceae bacterium]
MPLKLPNLDDRRWKDLVDEGTTLIPGWTRDWTNFNPSDPGITLLELFAHITETFLYRINRVGDDNMRAFLRLVNGHELNPDISLQAAIEQTLAVRGEPHRAVSARDFEHLTLRANNRIPAGEQKVARVRCIPLRNLESGKPTRQTEPAPGHVSVVIVPDVAAEPDAVLRQRVRDALEPARLLGTQLRIVGARFVPFAVRLTVIVRSGHALEEARENATGVLRSWFDIRSGGPAHDGWPFGRAVYVADIYRALLALPAVASLRRSIDPATGREMSELDV